MASICTLAGRRLGAFKTKVAILIRAPMAGRQSVPIARSARRSLSALGPGLLILMSQFLSVPAWAVVTYDGTEGVRANIFASNSQQACLLCHSTTSVDRHGSPSDVNFNTYAETQKSGSLGLNADRANARIQAETMPLHPDTLAALPLNSTEKSLINLWDSDGFLENAPPDVDTFNATSVGKYAATLRGDANENGLNSTFSFQYATNSSFIGSSTATPSPDFISGTGGGTESDTFFSVSTGSVLSCGTLYYYRIRTSSGASALGDTVTFTTDACPNITNPPNNESITEGELKQHDVDAAGGPVTFSLENQPSGMSIDSSTGVISWTPGEVLTSGTVTVRITDGTTEDTATFEWTVNSINDPPVITSTAPKVALETVEYQYDVVVADPDDPVGELSFSLSGEPAGMTIDAQGRIRWTPEIGQADVGPITVTVADGGEDKADPDSEVFSISVNTPDGDGDGVADYDDNCPSTANADQQDTDGDSRGDACDVDSDADGNIDTPILFTVDQAGEQDTLILQSGADVTVSVELSGAPASVMPSWDWTGTDSELAGLASGDTWTFDPDAPAIQGVFRLEVRATVDGNTIHDWILIDVRTAGDTTDSDNDGVPDSLDVASGSTVVLNGIGDGVTNVDEAMQQALETESGPYLRLGRVSREQGRTGALVLLDDIQATYPTAPNPPNGSNTGGWFDFEIAGLSESGASARVVLPLQSRLRSNSMYMKYHPEVGWQQFVSGDGDSIASAPRDGTGQCPGPNGSAWTSGLSAFHECIRLTLTDGGVNDIDGESNGVIRDPGGAVSASDRQSVEDPVDGGGGALGPRTLIGLLMGMVVLVMAGLRRRDETA